VAAVVAIVSLGDQERLVEQDERVGGWTLAAVGADRAEFSSDGERKVLYFTEEERAAAQEPPEPSKEPPARPRGAPHLGISGAFRFAVGGDVPPPPFSSMRRVFVVASVDPGSAAGRADLRQGDQILTIDGTPVHTGGQILGLRTRLEQGRAASVAVARRGMVLTLTVSP
jgi:membrane-associated protease RseP (regulator of RpoE activity)